MIETARSQSSPSQEEEPILPSGTSSSGTDPNTRVRAMVTIAKTKKLVKGTLKLLKTRQISRAADADVNRLSAENLDFCMLVISKSNAAEFWIQSVDEDRIRRFWLRPYYPKTVQLKKCKHVTPVLDAALIQLKRRVHVFCL